MPTSPPPLDVAFRMAVAFPCRHQCMVVSHFDLPHRTCPPSHRHLSDTSVTFQCPPFVHNFRTCPPSYMPTSPPARHRWMSHSLDVALPTAPSTFPPRPSPSHVLTISTTSQRHFSDTSVPAFRTQPSHVPTPHHRTCPPAHQPATVGCRILWMSHFPPPPRLSQHGLPHRTCPPSQRHLSASPQVKGSLQDVNGSLAGGSSTPAQIPTKGLGYPSH